MSITANRYKPMGSTWFALLALGIVITLAAVMRVMAVQGAHTRFKGLVPPNLSLALYSSGFTEPVDIASSNIPGDERLFIVERAGVIRIVDPAGKQQQTPFLDIADQVWSEGYIEQGLLGLVFDPDYTNNGYFFVNYTDNSGDTQITRFTVDPTNPDLADPDSEFTILTVDQPFVNHNAGDLAFGPDGYLYVPLGDGGGSGDPQDRAQDRADLLGKTLRIDVSGVTTTTNYQIPPDNPFVGDPNALDEIWSVGLRNPWRISFDRLTGDLYTGDVGEGAWEEINYQAAASLGEENYGWRCYEGNHAYNLVDCGPAGDYVYPIHEYSHAIGHAVTGGFVYRGSRYPSLFGHYIFADYISGRFWSLLSDGLGGWQVFPYGVLLGNPSTFGEDYDGELYVAGFGDGNIYRVVEISSITPTSAPTRTPDPTTTPTPTVAPSEFQIYLPGVVFKP